MDLYVLDKRLRQIEIFDKYESLIWTERWQAYGDFELIIASSIKSRYVLTPGTMLLINESERIMVIDTIIDKEDSEGRSMLNITGRSLEALLEDRAAIDADYLMTGTHRPRWSLTGTPGNIARQIFQEICVNGKLSTQDIIPYIQEGSSFPIQTIPEESTSSTIELEPTTVYQAIKNLCEENSLGFALVRDWDNAEMLFFVVYPGRDLTSVGYGINAPTVIFNPALENMQNTSELDTMQDYKTVAYVVSPTMPLMVYNDFENSSANEGFRRKVLVVNIENVRENPAEDALSMYEVLKRRGKEALNAHKRYTAFDGEITAGGYEYNTHYRLGDLVELQSNSTDERKIMRVNEQIFVSDAQGKRSYPTLTMDKSEMSELWDSYFE